MRKPCCRAAVALTLLGVSLSTILGCGASTDIPAARAATTVPATTRVTTVKAERMTIRRTTAQPGQIEAYEVTAIHAKLAGFVRLVAVDIGDKVKKGQVMAELRVPETDADVKQKTAMIDEADAGRKQSEAAADVAKAGVRFAEAKVTEIQAGIRRAEADVALCQAEFTRVQRLAQDRAVTGSLVDETRSKVAAAEATLEEVRAKVKSAEATLAEARAHSSKARSDVVAATAHVEVARFEAERAAALASYSKIDAPYDGVITRRNVDTGQLTMPGATGEPLFVVARSDRVTITVGVPETEAPFVNRGDSVQVRLQAYGGRAFEGKVSRTAWALDAATRTLRAEIDLPNTDDFLRPGLYAYATIIAEEHKDALTLPATAVFREGDKSFCVIVVNGRAIRREIQVGLSDAKRTEVLSGLTSGEEVIVASAASFADGQPVELQKPDGPPAKRNS